MNDNERASKLVKGFLLGMLGGVIAFIVTLASDDKEYVSAINAGFLVNAIICLSLALFFILM